MTRHAGEEGPPGPSISSPMTKAEEEGGLRDRRLNFRRFRRFLRRRAQNPLESTARDPTTDPGVPGSPFARLSNRAGRAADAWPRRSQVTRFSTLHPRDGYPPLGLSLSLESSSRSLGRIFTRFVNTTEFLREENLLHTFRFREEFENLDVKNNKKFVLLASLFLFSSLSYFFFFVLLLHVFFIYFMHYLFIYVTIYFYYLLFIFY